MMHTFGDIKNTQKNFKICEKCNKVNWHENTNCIECDSGDLNSSPDKVNIWVEEMIDYFKKCDTPYAISVETLYET